MKREKFVIVEKESGGVPAGEKRWLQHKIKVPAGPPTNFGYCKAIGIAYMLDVVAITPQMHQNVKVRVPITIGTVPLAVENIFSIQSLNVLGANQQEVGGTSQARPTDNPPPAYNDVVVMEAQHPSGKTIVFK